MVLAVVIAAITYLSVRSVQHFFNWKDVRSQYSKQIAAGEISVKMPLGFIVKEFDIDLKKLFDRRITKSDRGRSLELYCIRKELNCDDIVERIYEQIRQ